MEYIRPRLFRPGFFGGGSVDAVQPAQGAPVQPSHAIFWNFVRQVFRRFQNDVHARLVEEIEHAARGVDDLVLLTRKEVDPLDPRVALFELGLPLAAPIRIVGRENEPAVEYLRLAHTDVHRDEGAFAETDQRVPAQLYAAPVLLAQG